MDAPTCLRQTGDGKLRQTAAQQGAQAKRCVYECDQPAEGLGFQSQNVDSLPLMAGEMVKVLLGDRKSVACVQEPGFLMLWAKDISGFL